MSFLNKNFSAILVVLAGFLLKITDGAIGIYGEDAEPVGLSVNDSQIVVGVLTILIFVFMALEWFTPEVLLLTALIITLLLEILTLPEALSGKYTLNLLSIQIEFTLNVL